MKKPIFVFICIIIVVLISSCTIPAGTDSNINPSALNEQQNNISEEQNPESDTLTTEDNTETIEPTEPDEFAAFGGKTSFYLIESGENYELYAQIDGPGTYYKIWNEQEVLIDFGFHEKGSGIVQNGSLLEYSMSCGTYCRWVKYFDVHNNCASRFFNNPLATRDNLVVYKYFVDDKHCIVIQNIFDPASFYKVIPMDPAPDSAVLFEAFFLDDQQIQIKYSSEGRFITQVFNLYDAMDDLRES